MDVNADYIAYYEHVAIDRIQHSMNIYFTNNTIKHVEYTLSNTLNMKLVFDDYDYASTQDNLKLIIQLSRRFKICKHPEKENIRLFYNALGGCIAFNEERMEFFAVLILKMIMNIIMNSVIIKK